MKYACLPATESLSLTPCRTQSGWEVCIEETELWVRAAEPDPATWSSLPFSGRFTADAEMRLVRPGQSVPTRHIPRGDWVPLDWWLPVPRLASLPGGIRPLPVSVKPIRFGNLTRDPDFLITTIEVWEEWALMAPLSRLNPLSFAASSDGRVCVKGRPLPPLPGEAWVLHDQIALRAGFGFPHFCLPSWMATRLRLSAGAIAFWHEDGSHEIAPAPAFFPASRSNVRATGASVRASD